MKQRSVFVRAKALQQECQTTMNKIDVGNGDSMAVVMGPWRVKSGHNRSEAVEVRGSSDFFIFRRFLSFLERFEGLFEHSAPRAANLHTAR